MFIVSNNGDFDCKNIEEFKDILQECFNQNNGNEIWVSADQDEEFPCLSFLISNSGAVINYFSEDNEEQFASIGNTQLEGTEKFLGGQYEVECSQIVSLEKAMECALAFFEEQKRPEFIEWEEL